MGTEQGVGQVRHMSSDDEIPFPNLRRENYCVTSEKDPVYNCIAYAVGLTDTRWWPPVDGDEVEGVYWPPEALHHETLDAFVIVFCTRGYTPCDGPEPEDGYEKIAIYGDAEDYPTHAARQIMPSGEWSSKLGNSEDIKHRSLGDLEGLGEAYGTAKCFLKRKITEPFLPECLPSPSPDDEPVGPQTTNTTPPFTL